MIRHSSTVVIPKHLQYGLFMKTGSQFLSPEIVAAPDAARRPGRPIPVAAWLLLFCLCTLVPQIRAADIAKNAATAPAEDSAAVLAALNDYLAADRDSRPPLAEQAFADTPLSRQDADAARRQLWEDHVRRIRESRAGEMRERRLMDGDLEMPFHYETFGDKPPSGRRLFISMHGGGNAPARVNDRQWENQKRLYRPEEGVYVAPRAPTNTWNLWHEPHIDRLFDRLIENMIVFEEVDSNRVYILGYSAGGDGVYQLAPRMADRWAAAAMMAGHPNDALPMGLRNIGFTIHVGGRDGAYKRNEVAAEWGEKLDELHKGDPEGYAHLVKVYPDKPHWMDREDAAALPWMAEFVRNPVPDRLIWKQDDVTHSRFYWLAVDADQEKAGAEIVANFSGQQVELQTTDVTKLRVRLDDRMLDLDRPVTIVAGGKQVFQGTVPRTIATIANTLAERGDPQATFSGEVEVAITAERE
jgi:hypothetical protein